MEEINNIAIGELGNHEGGLVTLRGWLYGKRTGGKIIFLQMRDGTGYCQCVVEASQPEVFKTAGELTQESSFAVTGTVHKDSRAAGSYELAVTRLTTIQIAHDYPITRKAHGLDFLMSHRHLWLRSRRPTAILRIRHTLIHAIRDFFDSRGFTLIDTPILVQGAGEDAQTLFPVEYFDQKAFLAQTGQLYLESACMALGKVYCFGPTFRAEKSKTRRHLTEFWMVEPEVAFAELGDVMNLAEDMTCHVVGAVLAANEAELTLLGRDIEALRKVRKPFERITYSQAADILRSPETAKRLEGEMETKRVLLNTKIRELEELEKQIESAKASKVDQLQVQARELRDELADLEEEVRNMPDHIKLAANFEWGGDLGGSDETIISRTFERPVFVTHYPRVAKAFYMKRSAEDSRTVNNMDLLAPEGYGEIIGGSQREDDIAVLEAAIREKGLNPDDYPWYLDLRRYGAVPHGGFGLGIERTLTWICGLKHVRETIPFPRTMGRIYP